MPLNFPNSPTDGQLYTDTTSGNRWVWDNANTVWTSTSTFTQTITVSSTQPGSPVVGQLWWNQDYGRLFVYYNDGTSQQWVDANPADQTAALVFNTSNAAYGTANVGHTVANAAYNTANSGYVVANAAFGKANSALANTSGVTFAGDLFITGNVTFDNTNSVRISEPAANVLTITTASTERMRIDASGRNTRPFQPCWVGTTGTFSGTVTGSPNHVSGINYSGSGLPNGTLVNIGSIWNTTTGRVTIPVTGYYQINIIGHKDTNTVARDAIATLSVNGGYFEAIELYGNYGDGGASIILYLSANDWVEAGRNNGFANMSRVTFSGYLLG